MFILWVKVWFKELEVCLFELFDEFGFGLFEDGYLVVDDIFEETDFFGYFVDLDLVLLYE